MGSVSLRSKCSRFIEVHEFFPWRSILSTPLDPNGIYVQMRTVYVRRPKRCFPSHPQPGDANGLKCSSSYK